VGAGERREDFESTEALWELLTPLGVTPDRVEIIRHAFYEHHVLRARTWREGRVLLAGDAAHMMPPWAGQGMQSGIRDAQNLAWKLCCVLRGQLPDGVLDTYQVEREPHVVEMTRLTRFMGLLIAARNPLGVALRNNGLWLAQRLPVVGPNLRAFRFKPAPRLAGGFLAGRPGRRRAVGRMLPQPLVARGDGRRVPLDDCLGDGFAVIGRDVDPRELMAPAEREAWKRLDARFVVVRSALRPPLGDEDLVDFEDVLCPWLERHRARVIVLRPDRFVVADDRTGLGVPEVGGTRIAALAPREPVPAPAIS
jgi:3-(3-hydroxy-phenyl)propionate hydroxylase